MGVQKTIFIRKDTTVRERQRKSGLKKLKSLTQTSCLQIDELFRDIPLTSVSYLHVICPHKEPFKVSLSKDAVSIGRTDDATVVLPLTSVSRVHARIVCRGESHLLEDMDSTNGTFLNGVRIKSCILHNNDHIRIGEARIQFVEQKIRDRA